MAPRCVQPQHQQRAVVEPLRRLVEMERRQPFPTASDVQVGVLDELLGAGEPLIEVALRLRQGFGRRQRLGLHERVVRRLIERDRVAHDVHEERPAAFELAVDVVQAMHDQAHRRAQPAGDHVLAQKVLLGLRPVFHHVGQPLVVDHHQDVIVAQVAGDGIVHPVAARVRAVERHLEDAALALVRLRAQRRGVLELLEEDLHHALQLALLGRRQVLQGGLHHRDSRRLARPLQAGAHPRARPALAGHDQPQAGALGRVRPEAAGLRPSGRVGAAQRPRSGLDARRRLRSSNGLVWPRPRRRSGR